jgi:hypothetical protein
MKVATAKEVLVAAKWLLDHYGWTRLTMWRTPKGEEIGQAIFITDGTRKLGSCCLLGALSLVECTPQAKSEAHLAILNAIYAPYISFWNDDPDRTKQDVIVLLDKLINEA